MSSNSILSFRTITRCGIFRQARVDDALVLLPIALSVPPESAGIAPNPTIETTKEMACDGRMVPSFSYERESNPSLELGFGMAVADLESLIHGRIVATAPTTEAMVFAELTPTTAPSPARIAGQIGYTAIAQVAATTRAKAFYVDPVTKLAVPLAIIDVAGTPAGDQIEIAASLAVTFSPELVTAGNTVYIWCPCPLAEATVITSRPIGLISVFLAGVNFDNTARLMIARNCSRAESGGLTSDPKRSIKLNILPDPQDGTGLGFQIVDTALQMVC